MPKRRVLFLFILYLGAKYSEALKKACNDPAKAMRKLFATTLNGTLSIMAGATQEDEQPETTAEVEMVEIMPKTD